MEILQQQSTFVWNFEKVLAFLTLLSIVLNFNRKLNLIINFIILYLVFKTKNIQQVVIKKNDLAISSQTSYEILPPPQEPKPLPIKKVEQEVDVSPVSSDLEISDEILIIDRQGDSSVKNKISQNHSKQTSLKRQAIRDLLLKNVIQGAMLCKITEKKQDPLKRMSVVDVKKSSLHSINRDRINLANSYNIRLGESSRNHDKFSNLLLNKKRKISIELIEISDKFQKVFEVHYKLKNIPVDHVGESSQHNASQNLEDPHISTTKPANGTGSHSKNLYNSNHSLINSLSINSNRMNFVRSTSLMSQRLSASESNAGLNLLEQQMLELKIYQPYFISNETIIQYQAKKVGVPQKLSILDILEAHFLQKRAKSRLYFKVDLTEDVEKSQNLEQNFDYTESSLNKTLQINDKTFKSNEMEEIAEQRSIFEHEKQNENSGGEEVGKDESLDVEKSRPNVQSSDSSLPKKYCRKRCNTSGKNLAEYVQKSLAIKKERSNSFHVNKQIKIELVENSVSSSSSDDMDSYLNHSIANSSESSRTSHNYSNEASGLQQNKTHSINEEKTSYFEFEIKQLRDSFDYQDLKNITFLNIKDVTNLVKNQRKFCDKTYQDAIENNYSHEQMTPLNPILNYTPIIKQNLINMYAERIKNNRKYSATTNHQTIEGFEISDLAKVIQNQKDAKLNLHNIISIEQSAKSIWYYNTNQIQRMKIKKNQLKVEAKPNSNIICTLWNVIWPFEHYIFRRRINIFLITNLWSGYEMVSDWGLYELVLYNILQNALKYNQNFDGDIVITMSCKRVNNSNSQKKYIFETQVIDSGIGIEPNRQKMLFIPFQELKHRIGISKSSNDSIGIGLACSSDICKKLGGDITLKKSEPGLTVIAFKFPVTLRNKQMCCNSMSDRENMSDGRNSGSFQAFDMINSSGMMNLRAGEQFPSRFSNMVSGKNFEYIKLIGNSRGLNETLKEYLTQTRQIPMFNAKPSPHRRDSSSRNNKSISRSTALLPFFKEVFSFPNQRIGFQLLESLERQTSFPSSLSGKNSIKSILSNFNPSNQRPDNGNRTGRKSSTNQSDKSQLFQGLIRQQSQSILQLNKHISPQSPDTDNNSEDFSVEDDVINQHQNQGSLSSVSQDNIIKRSLSISDVEKEESKKCESPKIKMGMILEIEDEQIDSHQVISVAELPNQSDMMEVLVFEDKIIEEVYGEEEEEKEPRQHLKKLKVKPVKSPESQESPVNPSQLVPPSLIHKFSLMDFKNLDRDQKRFTMNQILNQGKYQKIVNRMMSDQPLRLNKKPRIFFDEKVNDILIDEDKQLLQLQGLQKYKLELKKKDIIYQLSESSSEEFKKSSFSSSSEYSHESAREPVDRKDPKLKRRLPCQSWQQESLDDEEILIIENNPYCPNSQEERKFKSDMRGSEQQDDSISNSSEPSSLIQNFSDNRQVMIGSQIIISLNNERFSELLSQNKDNICDCEPKILIVEDTEFNMMTIVQMIQKKFDISPCEAQNGQIAIDMIKDLLKKPCKCPNRAFKMIIMDIQMPVKDGYQATKEILQLMKNAGLQDDPKSEVDNNCNIIALTSYTADEVKQKCLDLNMKELYNKPLNAAQLKESINKYFFQTEENLVKFYQLRLMRQIINQQLNNS